MAAMQYSGTISALSTNNQFLGVKKVCAKFQNDISQTEGLCRVL